jgi:hypothetical protein
MRTVLLLLLASFAVVGFGQTYKWRDASGSVQYSDTPPPPGAKDVQQLRRGSSAAAAPSSGGSRSFAEQDAEFRKRQVEKQEAEVKQAKTAEDEQLRARNCTQAKGQLAAIETGARMVQVNAQGERVALDDSERDRARQDAMRAIESWCNK